MQGARFFPGQKIDQYILGEQIATGGMGQVFLAFQESMNRHVAIKFLPPVDSENADTVARFKREVTMISRLEHPHIVPVYGFGDVYGVPYIVMRHMSGGTLREHFQDGRLNLQRILEVVDQAVAALDYAHEQGIIHRDIKPSNIFLDERDNAYLADFGLAKTVSGSHDLTRTDEGISGTPEYMSPEQVRGQKLDGRTDIYSMGVIVFQILSGHPPFAGQNPMETVLKQISDPIPSIHALQPELPKELDDVFKKVLAKNAEERYQVGREFVSDLREVLSSKPLNWMPTTGNGNGLVNVKPESKTKYPVNGAIDPTQRGIDPQLNGSDADATVRDARWFQQPQQRTGFFVLTALLIVGLIIGGYLLYDFNNNPIRQLAVTQTPAIADSPLDIEFDDQGAVWVISQGSGEVLKLEADCPVDTSSCGDVLDRFAVGSRPLFLAVGEEEILVGRQLSQGLTSISLNDNSIRLIEFPHIPADAVVYGESIWITSGRELIEIDFEGQVLASFDVGVTPNALYQTEDFIWVALEGEGRLRRYNLLMRDFDIDLPLSVEHNQLISITGDEANQQIWATFNREDLLIQIDSKTGALLGSYDTKSLPVDIGAYGGRVWIVAKGDSEIVAHNGLSGSIIGEVTAIDSPSTMTIESCGIGCAYLWVASDSAGTIHRINLE